ncbi:MAG: FAD-binding and (Fe-S)-binding domain-containing protein [Caldilineaceae bacterium]
MTTRVTPPRSSLTAADMRSVAAENRDLAEEFKHVVQGEVRFDGFSRMLYSTDASLYQIQPIGVVIPRNVEDVQAVVEIAAKRKVPVLARGGGSSLAGQAVGAAVILDFSKFMDRIISLDPEARTVRTEPGIGVTALNDALAPHGIMLGPDPASADRATIGGSAANNATGSHSILYGMLADSVLETGVVLSDGSLARFGPLTPDQLPLMAKRDGLEGYIYKRIPDLVRESLDDILAHFPKHWRRTSGYSLDRLAAALLPLDQRALLSFDSRFRPAICDPRNIDSFNLTQLMTGSEGTLAVMTDLTMRLVPRPTRTALAVIHFDDVVAACAAIPDILETEPSASELLDKQLMDLARAQPEWARRLDFVEGDPAAVLLTEYYGESEAELEAKLNRLHAHLAAKGFSGAYLRIMDAARQKRVWSVRKAGLNLLMGQRGEYKPVPGIEDVSVPPERLAEYIADILAFCRQQGDIPAVAIYAHASAGCLHVRPLLNTKTARGVELLQVLGSYACDLAMSYGGAMSGEHGDGLARSPHNIKLFGPALYATMQEVKIAFDPDNLMNPGKIVNAAPLTQNLRYGESYETIQLDTVFDWKKDGGFAEAVEMCNGAGVCRKIDIGNMCPTFMATRDEADSTRGRANALRNALAGRVPHEQLFSEDTYEVMHLCMGCKACKSECPSAVDMAKIKFEYLVQYFERHGTPLFNRLMGLLPVIDELIFRFAKPFIPLINWGMGTPIAKYIFSLIGIDPRRSMPTYDNETFETWFRRRTTNRRKAPVTTHFPNGPVIIFHDTWVNYNETRIGEAMVRVLEAAGYQVFIAAGRKCCGRTLITGGQANKARPWIDHNVALLAPYAQRGIPIVGVEPSCILTLRDEYLDLASDPARARVLAQGAFTFEEFVHRELQEGRFRPAWKPGAAKALLHGHCHHKAMVGNAPTEAVLTAAGYEVEVIQSGCCGMAGNFGYEKANYDLSKKIGDERLFSVVRAAPESTTVVASGTSCRHQIKDFTGRLPLHLAEALANRLAL